MKDQIFKKGFSEQTVKKPFPIGLALSGGSVKGFAHLGVLKYMIEIDKKPDIIAGTSSGALMGAFYADGYHPDEIMEILGNITFSQMTNLLVGFGKGGIFGVNNFTRLLKKNIRHKNIEDLEIPLRIVATDIDHGKEKVFTSGNIVDRVIASCSIPVIFAPIKIDGVHYVDGGLFRNLPASVIRNECDKLIGVNLNPESNETYKRTLISTAVRSWTLVFRQNSIYDAKICDILLETSEVTKYKMFESKSSVEIMNCGYNMALNGLTL